MSERDPLVRRLKSGEYDGKDIMLAWLAIEGLMEKLEVKHAEIAALTEENEINKAMLRYAKKRIETLLPEPSEESDE